MTLFNDPKTDPVDASLLSHQPANTSVEDPFALLVGEGKKYKNEQDLAKSVLHSQTHIQRIEKENAEMRELLTKNDRTARLEEMITQLLQKNSAPSNEAPPAREEPVDNGKNTLSDEDLEAKFEQLLTKKTTEQTRRSNLSVVKDKLLETYGDSFAEVVKQKGAELGLDENAINDLASRNPKLFFKTFDVQPTAPKSPVSVKNELNSGITNVPSVGPKPRSHYLAIKQKDPAAYYKPAVQRQMEADALKLGAAFFDSDN